MQRIPFFLLLAFAPLLSIHAEGNLYGARLSFVNLGIARQSPIEAKRSERGRPFPVGKASEEDRLGKVAASPNSQNLSGHRIAAASAESEACGKEIELIDKQVEKLEKEKQQHQDLARQFQKAGDNWQYSTGNIQDAYANWNKADQERRKAINIQQQVDLLLQRRSRIIQFYPELYQP